MQVTLLFVPDFECLLLRRVDSNKRRSADALQADACACHWLHGAAGRPAHTTQRGGAARRLDPAVADLGPGLLLLPGADDLLLGEAAARPAPGAWRARLRAVPGRPHAGLRTLPGALTLARARAARSSSGRP
jgi:hypothetical protein